MKGKIYYLYSYSLTHLAYSNRVRAVYVLKGRDEEIGIVRLCKGKFISKGCFMVPEKHNKEIKQVMDQWKIKYESRKIMLMD